LSHGSVAETVYTLNSVPVSCQDFPATSDTYVWKVRPAKITGDFEEDLANNVIIVAYSGSCDPLSDVTNTLEIPPGAASIQTDDLGLVHVNFDATVPDFNSNNTSNDVNLPYFNQIGFHMLYNPTQSAAGGLNPGVGTLEVSGNANLCNILPAQQQCFILDLGTGDTADDDVDLACVCATPSVEDVDISSIFLP
jgi:hypothetical protein